ncbi:putative peroxisome assembly protein 12 [Scheffersomyces amazonensis]|uniref:putative peroxisome assembly protein 12 n=1 Tax=Scheffersomyces amazonensis TaxID=1078765 RepID=UPI00315C9833
MFNFVEPTNYSRSQRSRTWKSMEYYSSLDASQLDADRPTLFELISSNQLEALLSPSLRYILVHYASKYPYYLLRINNNFDELNLVLRTFIEWYFIKYWQGSFTENFYGLKRVNQTLLSDSSKYNSGKLVQLVPSIIEENRSLTKLQQIVSIFEITGSAYISEKLNYTYEVWYTKYITNQLNTHETNTKEENFKIQLKRKFVEIYPYLQSAYRAGNFITTILYLSGSTKSPSILTYLFGINYSRLSQYDYTKNEPKTELPSSSNSNINRVAPPSTLEYVMRLITKNFTDPSWKVIKTILGTFFPVAIFTLKFLEWWNNSDFAAKLSKNQGNVLDFTIPPPSFLSEALKKSRQEKLKSISKNKKVRKYKSGNICPICKNEITNPAIIETGYVFDYACIYNYLQNSHKIVAENIKSKLKANKKDGEESDSDSEIDSEIDSEDERDTTDKQEKETETETEKKEDLQESESHVVIDIKKGGRCPITGKKLLGCKWNPIKEEWDIEGIRKLIF